MVLAIQHSVDLECVCVRLLFFVGLKKKCFYSFAVGLDFWGYIVGRLGVIVPPIMVCMCGGGG